MHLAAGIRDLVFALLNGGLEDGGVAEIPDGLADLQGREDQSLFAVLFLDSLKIILGRVQNLQVTLMSVQLATQFLEPAAAVFHVILVAKEPALAKGVSHRRDLVALGAAQAPVTSRGAVHQGMRQGILGLEPIVKTFEEFVELGGAFAAGEDGVFGQEAVPACVL
jgi:hypothetical protein